MDGSYQPHTFKTHDSPIIFELESRKHRDHQQKVKNTSKWFL